MQNPAYGRILSCTLLEVTAFLCCALMNTIGEDMKTWLGKDVCLASVQDILDESAAVHHQSHPHQ